MFKYSRIPSEFDDARLVLPQRRFGKRNSISENSRVASKVLPSFYSASANDPDPEPALEFGCFQVFRKEIGTTDVAVESFSFEATCGEERHCFSSGTATGRTAANALARAVLLFRARHWPIRHVRLVWNPIYDSSAFVDACQTLGIQRLWRGG